MCVCVFSDGAAGPADFTDPGHRVSEQRHREHRPQPAHRRGERADRHRHHRGARAAEGAAGPHPGQGETGGGAE